MKRSSTGVKRTHLKTNLTFRKIYRNLGLFVSTLSYPIILLNKRVIRPFQKRLSRKWQWYRRWRRWQYRPHAYITVLVPVAFMLVAVIAFDMKGVFAATISSNWTFTNPADYNYDNTAIDITGANAKLKAQNYTSDADTAALYHMDEINGTTITDSSSNGNNGTLVGAATFTPGRLNNALSLDGTSMFASIPDSSSLTLAGSQTLEANVKFNTPFSTSSEQDQGIIDKGSYRLYYDRTSGRINYEIANSSANTWVKRAGSGINGSWDLNGKTAVQATVTVGGDKYAGLGLSVGDAEVWRFHSGSWSKVGGDGINNSWADQTYENVYSLTVNGTILYAGLGLTAGDAEVWSCDTSTGCLNWSKVGGDGFNGSWGVNTFESVFALTSYGGDVYAGLGQTVGDAEVWRYDSGGNWTKIGGDGINGSWNTVYESVRSLVSDGAGGLYAGIGDTAGDAAVYRWNGSTWTKVGGDGVNGSWASADNIEYVQSLDYFGGKLYAGTGISTGDADVWQYSGGSWTKIGGDGINGGWAASTYEGIGSLTNDGTSLYAGTGTGNGDGEVWKFTSGSWTKLGGDGVNGSWPSARGDAVYAMQYSGGKLNVGLYDSGGDALFYEWDGSNWTQIGGGYYNNSWGFYGLQSVESATTYNDKLYMGTGVSVAGNALVWEFDGNNWTKVGGQGLRGSWAQDTYENVYSRQQYKGNLYAGLGPSANDGEVWKYDGTSWTQVGGDGINNGWGANYEAVWILTVFDGKLYAGLGNSANDAEVWAWDGSNWTKVGGDGVGGGWSTNHEAVMSMTVYSGELYAGLGTSTNDSEVWKYDGSTWTQVGGDGVASSWNGHYEEVDILRIYNGKLYAGLGAGAGDAEVWEYDGSTWTLVGGSDVNNSWTSGTYERIRSMAVYNGQLYVGTGDSAGDGEVWAWNGTTWVQMGGDSINDSWGSTIEYVGSLIDYHGRLYAGTGVSANADAMVYSIGDNAYLAGTATTQDTNWHHIAATYNGLTMKLYVDGVENASTNKSVVPPDNNIDLRIGSTYGSGGRGETQGYFGGQIDEVRLSSNVRTDFTSKPYVTTKKTISLVNPIFTSGVQAFTAFTTNEATNGGTITYRLSTDGGSTWIYWDTLTSNWITSGSINQANSSAEVNSHITSVPVTFGGLVWQAIFDSDGNQQVTLNSVNVDAQTDTNAPDSNAANITALRSSGGAALASNDWTNGASPYFSWDPAIDSGAGIYGYCLYLGLDNTADPATTKGLLGTSLKDTGNHCQFITPNTNIDLGALGVMASPMTTSTSPYYLVVEAIDKAGNTYPTTTTFHFRFDNTPPLNPGFISGPSGFINTKDATLTWPTSGGQSASDGASGVAGLQYKIEGGSWYGDSHTGTGDISDLLANDGSYQTVPTPDYNDIAEGTNTVYFRTWDNAGNISVGTVSAALKINTNGSPSEPLNLTATPTTNTANSFSFSWSDPTSFVGSASSLNYCYTVNVLPSAITCNFTGNGIKSLPTGPYATQPGLNTLYVVAKDESSNINYASYAAINFTANTSAPGIPGNVDIVDVSIKSTSKWRLAITWDTPTNVGDGISSYKIYRSINGTTFNIAGTSSSTTYIDAGLTQIPYYYRVVACDSTNNCSANSSVVSMIPTGKFTEPANLIGEPAASNITTKRAVVQWTTDRNSDSKIALGTSSGHYGQAEIGNSDQVVIHDIQLDNLAAGTTYYYVVKWTDTDGNTGISQEHTFTTKPAPVIKEIAATRVGLSSAVIGFTSVGSTKVNLYYGESDSFGGLQSVNTSSAETPYSMELDGLKDGTKYYYMLSAFDSEGSEYKGNIFSFTTPPRPHISNLRFEPVEGEPTSTQSITWTTNVPSTSTITYGKVGSGGTDVLNSELTKEHKIIISGLEDDSDYFLVARGRDADGNLAVSDSQRFRTALDTRPPVISNVTIETSIRGTGSEARGQVIVSWRTDEPSTSQVGYADGSTATVFNNKTSEDTQRTTEHIVVLSNLPTSKVYSIQAISYDKSRNMGVSDPQTSIVGRANESVLTIILNALQRVFGL